MKRVFFIPSLAIAIVVALHLSKAWAAGAGITYHGRLIDPAGGAVVGANVQFKIQLRTPGNENCLLYEEVQSKDLSQTEGIFSLTINDGTGTRLDSSGYNLDQIFANRGSFSFSSGQCATGSSYNTNPTDGRKIQVLFNDGTFAAGTWEAAPAVAINFIPMAIESMQIGGYKPGQLLKIADGVSTTGTELNNASWTELLALIGGSSTQYAKTAGTVFTAAPQWAGVPSSGNDLVNKTYLDGQIAAGLPNIGTAGTYTKVTTDVKGRVTSGTTLSESDIPTLSTAGKVSGSAINAGSIGGSTTINSTGNLVTTGTVQGSIVGATNLRAFSGPYYLQLSAPPGLNGSVNFLLPASDGASGTLLKTNGSGQLSFTALGAADIPALDTGKLTTGTLPVTRGGTGTATLGINSVLVSNATGSAINSLNCASGEVIKFDVLGNAGCGSDTTGSGSQWTTTASDIYYATGRVGIGTANPAGTLDVQGGTATAATNGVNIQLTAQNAGAGSANGGYVNLRGGLSTGTGIAGKVTLNGGLGAVTGGNVEINGGYGATTGGQVTIVGGQSGGPGSTGGAAYLIGGWGGGASAGTGGPVIVQGGTGGSPGDGGSATLIGGSPTTSGNGGSAFVTGTAGFGTNKNGGNVVIAAGSATGSGTPGTVRFVSGNVGIGTASPSALLDVNGTMRVNQICDSAGANCKTISGGWSAASGLSTLTAATGTGTIDNTNYAQTWNWSTATTQSPMAMTADSLTTGSLLNLTSSSASLNSTNGLLNVANTSASTTGTVARIQSNSTAGSGLTVLANGNVGIGTASPGSRLHIDVPTSIATFKVTGGTDATPLGSKITLGANPGVQRGINFNYTNSGGSDIFWMDGENGGTQPAFFYTKASVPGNVGLGYFTNIYSTNVDAAMTIQSKTSSSSDWAFDVFNSSNSKIFAVRADGNIGIGTSTPVNKLDIVSGDTTAYIATSGTATIPSTTAAASIRNYKTPGTGSNSVSALLYFDVLNATGINEWAYFGAIEPGTGSYTPAIVFGQRTGLNSYSESMRIDENGNLGLGTSSPKSKLHGVMTMNAATGNEVAYSLNYTTDKATSGNDTGLLISMTDTASPGISLPLNIQVNGVSKFSVDQTGGLTTGGGAVALNGDTAIASNKNLSMSGAGTFYQSFSSPSQIAHTIDAPSLLNGGGLVITSSSTNFTGNLQSVALWGNNPAVTGTVLKLAAMGAASAAIPLLITNQGTGLTLRVNDDGTDTDPTPFVIDASGNVGIGTTSPQTTLQVEGVITPATNNTYTLGNATYRFTEVYATNGVINTSDRREKKDVANTDLGLDFLNTLRPVSYRWNTGVDSEVHYGLIAQEAEQALAEIGKKDKTSIVTHDAATDRYGVRYSELISPLIKAVQELYEKVMGVHSRQGALAREIASVKEDKADRVEVNQLKAENETLKQLNAIQAKEMAELKAYMCKHDKNAPFCQNQ